MAGVAPLVAGLGGVHAVDPGEATGRVLLAPGGCPACLTAGREGNPELVSGWLCTLAAQVLDTLSPRCPPSRGGRIASMVPPRAGSRS